MSVVVTILCHLVTSCNYEELWEWLCQRSSCVISTYWCHLIPSLYKQDDVKLHMPVCQTSTDVAWAIWRIGKYSTIVEHRQATCVPYYRPWAYWGCDAWPAWCQLQSIAALWFVPNYTAWWHRNVWMYCWVIMWWHYGRESKQNTTSDHNHFITVPYTLE